MDPAIQERVIQVLERVIGKKIKNFDLTGDIQSQLSLDSIQIVELFASLEKELDLELPLQLMTVRTGKAFFELLEKELNHRQAS